MSDVETARAELVDAEAFFRQAKEEGLVTDELRAQLRETRRRVRALGPPPAGPGDAVVVPGGI